ncbi:formyltetrahydrofolate deformylase [Naumannella halotolerans]|uniref:Formyltetrahydrofolate deformylase n=1 Tax=Naumannella halotolerans TaxID=993414 RepID=A0A4R7J9Z9_9ACTN|nr:formyltetrahydrofolate deformylase [Naumannella halotolerans]TDT34185.1 formyltetrahydrofolate deformylase [Naumannella halotolerans]
MSQSPQNLPETPESHLVLTLTCPDRPGIVHAVTGAVVEAGGNITELQQFSADSGQFFLRLQAKVNDPAVLRTRLAEISPRFDAGWNLDRVDRKVRTLILASKAGHCLNQLLFAQRDGTLPIEVPQVLANHPNLAELADFHQVPFEHLPVTPQTKSAFEDRVRQIVAEHDIELVVLARYMQILSPELCADLAGKAINIHHSFLPGFKGANPYRQAHERGVKLIGATAHFVTSELDEGPIIEQDVIRVDHSRTPSELVRIGQDAESRTLTEAVRLFAQHRVLLDGRRTVVFS